jgi:ligand-binding sensor domain-containing protein
VNSLAINLLGHIFAGTAGGVFRSTNDGDFWVEASNGLLPPDGNVWTLAIDSRGFLFAGTAGAGVFRSVNSTAPVHVPPRPRVTPYPRPTPP